MKAKVSKWYNFCGVDVTGSGDVMCERGIDLKLNRLCILPFRQRAVLIIQIGNKWFYSEIPLLQAKAYVLSHYTLRHNESGYLLQGYNNKFPIQELTEDLFDNELHPLSPERRAMRDQVMAQYKEPYKYNLRF